MSAWFDTHSHIADRGFDADRAAVLARARAADVASIVVIGDDERGGEAAVRLAATDARLWATVGLHPHDARTADPGFDARLDALARGPRVVAVGEIGLDFHYDRSPRDVQIDLFRRQLAVAAACDLPVVIHSREALRETLAVLGPWCAARDRRSDGSPRGVMHCFGYDLAAALEFIDLGFLISIAGPVTYPRAETTQRVACELPDEALVLETDAPVLSPQAHRGRRNEPAYLVETAAAVARLRGVSLESLATLTTANARRLFRLPSPVGDDPTREYVPA